MPSTNPTVVVHTVKTVRKHHIEFRLPQPPPDDEESVVITLGPPHVGRAQEPLDLRVGDFQQLIACLVDGFGKVTGQTLKLDVRSDEDKAVAPSGDEPPINEPMEYTYGPVVRADDRVPLTTILHEVFGVSRSEARRSIAQGGVSSDRTQVNETDPLVSDLDGTVLRLGVRRGALLHFNIDDEVC